MDTVKQLFDIFIDRTLAYNYSHNIGLITFDDQIKFPKEINEVTRDFRQELSAIVPDGLTALWDALKRARTELMSYSVAYPNAIKRIIVLTDGEDNMSTVSSREVCYELQVRSLTPHTMFIAIDIRYNRRLYRHWR